MNKDKIDRQRAMANKRKKKIKQRINEKMEKKQELINKGK